MRSPLQVGTAVFALLTFAACQDVEPVRTPTEPGESRITTGQLSTGGPAVALELIADGLTSPVTLAEAPDGSGRLFIVDQTGLIRVCMPDGTLLEDPFLDVRDRMVTLDPGYDERGLLGLAFHPEFASNGRFFVYYTAPPRLAGYDNTSRVSEFQVSEADPNQADPASEQIIIEEDQPQFNHEGGTIAFGPDDGYLYISWGDGGGANDIGFGHVDDWYEANAGGNGQDIEQNLLGNILRIDVSTPGSYSIPPDNPFVGTDGLDEIYAYGFRNPYRFSFDMGGDHDLFVGDAGQNLWEEVSVVEKGGNYGWNVREGTHCFDAEAPLTIPDSCPDEDAATGIPLTDPVIEFANSANPFVPGVGLTVVGGHVYRGDDVPQLGGRYIFGTFSKSFSPEGVIFSAKPRNANRPGLWPMQTLQVTNIPGDDLGRFLKGFGQDLDGEVYVLTSTELGPTGNTGEVFRFARPE